VIRLERVSKSFQTGRTRVQALREVSLEIERGSFACLMGPSGSGKSTLLNLIACLDRADSGTVSVLGREVGRLSRDALAALRAASIGIVFQSFNLIPVLDVYENVEFPFFVGRGSVRAAERRGRVRELLRAVGLEDFAGRKPDELSGGQRQRVAIARALVLRPELVLADEPTANLDTATGRAAVELMRSLNASEGTTFVFSTHDPAVAEFASPSFRLRDGRLAED
jgi:putative ABC transport system ATP-binding protein